MGTLNRLKEDYEHFAPEGRGQPQTCSNAELRRRERRFLGNFLQAMSQGEFIPLGQEIYTEAASRSYMMDVPAEVDWEAYDDDLLAGFHSWVARGGRDARRLRLDLGLERSLDEFLSTAEEVGHNAWVFYRGIERDQVSGTFLRRKLGLLSERVLRGCLFPLVAPLEWLVRTVRASPGRGPRRTAERTRQHVHDPRWIRRKNLRNEPLLDSLFRGSHFQEPALRQVILLYRLKPKPNQDGGQQLREDRKIHIKTFSHIPLADAEVVFPEKLIRTRAFDVAVLIVTALAAVPALYQAAQGGGAALLVFALLATFIWRLVTSFRRVRQDYAARMTEVLYDKTLDNSTGVLQWLVDSLEAQEFKEALLVYSTLLEHGPLNRAELDARIERFLRDRFQVTVDFDLAGALEKVVDRGDAACLLPVVEASSVDAEEVYRAKPVEEALRTLDAKWDALSRFNSAA